jgi:N-acetylmuramoyl-L-alanine amidase
MNSEKNHKHLITLMSLLLICAMAVLSREAAIYTMSKMAAKKHTTVVIDSGHGGTDPGKATSDGTLEKDLNLAIALKLQKYLEAADITVIMTRVSDDGLYDASSKNKKVQDMQNRVAIMNDESVNLVVSIHQNSYSDPRVKGAQVFYYGTSTDGSKLADVLQNRLVADLDPENHRKPKANNSYYLLKKTTRPTVIVECGFLSNPAEAEKLKSETYQDALAWSLHMGILEYLNADARTK